TRLCCDTTAFWQLTQVYATLRSDELKHSPGRENWNSRALSMRRFWPVTPPMWKPCWGGHGSAPGAAILHPPRRPITSCSPGILDLEARVGLGYVYLWQGRE